MREGHNISVLETFIALVLFCKKADYDDRIQLVFNVFDADHGGTLDRKETSKMLQSSIFGLCKLAGLPSPSKIGVTEYISDMFKFIDEDGSGQVEYLELKEFIDNDMDIQDFILRFSGVQTFARASIIFQRDKKRWKDFFDRISIDYFGDNFVEAKVLKHHLDIELAKEC